jgi:hypothetical protein
MLNTSLVRNLLSLPFQLGSMTVLTRVLLVLVVVMLADCKSKKKASLSGDDPVEITDFIDFFPAKKSYQFADTTLLKKDRDSLLISNTVFTQFVPDSILTRVFGKTIPKLYPMARLKGNETYLFTKAVAGNKRAAFILGFDKKNKFLASIPIMQLDQSPATQQIVSIDSRFNITTIVQRKNADGTVSEGKDVYYLSKDGGGFGLIMTDPLDDKVGELTNPIDTFSRKQKFTSDYGSGKMNIVSFRDGRKSDRLTFYIHFEKNNGECIGELKGEAIMKTATQAEYRESGEPCSLQFTFTSSTVMIKEINPCGSRRGLRCSFDGVYFRKKESTKPKSTKSKAT